MKTVIKAPNASTPALLAATFAALACTAHAGTVQAAPPSPPLTKVVSYAGLDLYAQSDAKVLYTRIRSAAKQVCAPLESIELTLRRSWQSCVNEAVASAVQHVNAPTLTALHEVSRNHPSAG
jgi:UrcA family protein